VDLVRWAALHVTARAVAAAAVPPLTRLAATATSARTKADGGFVAYLRTDLELSVTPLMAGGSVAHTDGILNALLTRGHDVTYLGTGTVDGIPARVACGRLYALLKGNLPVEVAELISGLIQGCMSRRKLVSLGSSPRVSFIYQRYSLNNLAGVILARRLRIPLVLEANDSEAKWRQDFGTLKYPRLAYGCERLILRQADVVATVSRNAAEDLLAAGAPSERLHVVPNGVTVSRFQNASPVTLPPNLSGSFVVCFVGLFYPWHGVRFLAEAFGLLHSRRGEVGLLLVGDGEDAPVAKAVLDRSAAGAASHFAGLVPRSEVPRYMAAADVLVAPHADTEHFIGSPIKVFEYMASGKPIVATRVGQIEQVLDDGKTALLVPPEDPEAMAAAFERLYSDRALGRRLGQAAREEARANHSWDARVASIVDALHESASGDTE
jgi:glycosyltransferase involved in cell wall biosynthesis